MIVRALDRLATVVSAIQALRRRHAGYGLTRRHLDLGGAALLRALADHSEPLDPALDTAWSPILSGVMLDATLAVAAADAQ